MRIWPSPAALALADFAGQWHTAAFAGQVAHGRITKKKRRATANPTVARRSRRRTIDRRRLALSYLMNSISW
jgi:hypothetical protein